MKRPCQILSAALLATMGESTGGAAIFGVTGGVMEASPRFVRQGVTKKSPASWDFKQVRGLDGFKEFTATIDGTEIRTAVVHGARRFARRASQDNVQVQDLYRKWLDRPIGHLSEEHLHTR